MLAPGIALFALIAIVAQFAHPVRRRPRLCGSELPDRSVGIACVESVTSGLAQSKGRARGRSRNSRVRIRSSVHSRPVAEDVAFEARLSVYLFHRLHGHVAGGGYVRDDIRDARVLRESGVGGLELLAGLVVVCDPVRRLHEAGRARPGGPAPRASTTAAARARRQHRPWATPFAPPRSPRLVVVGSKSRTACTWGRCFDRPGTSWTRSPLQRSLWLNIR